MLYSNFKSKSAFPQLHCVKASKSSESQVDQFAATEFFRTKQGLLSDVSVGIKYADNPEIAAKIDSYFIEQDIAGFDTSVDDEEVFNQLQSKYITRQSILADMKSRIKELRSKPVKVEETKPVESAS